MKLRVYKGFDLEFLKKIEYRPLIDSSIESKKNIFVLNNDYLEDITNSIFIKKDIEEAWITYEEFELAYDVISLRANQRKISIEIINNNVYPEIYPIELNISPDLYDKYSKSLEDNNNKIVDKEVSLLEKFYSRIENVDNKFYASYYNFEIPNNANIDYLTDYYPSDINIESTKDSSYVVDIGNDVVQYIKHINNIQKGKYNKISYKMFCNNEISKLILNSLKAYIKKNKLSCLYEYKGEYIVNDSIRQELINVATKILKKDNFQFRNLRFYKQPEISNEMETVSQAEIMEYIVNEAEKAYRNERYRDIFITAPTGSGKSMIFQIPSIYLANKYHKLIIIIEPLKGLQSDQQKNLKYAGYNKSAYLNSDITTKVEREKIINDVKNGDIDILYVSPETLMSHSIDSLFGDREIGLVIVDEAHIVTTWGVGFRPDYWYLGTYLNRLRAKRDKSGKEKSYHSFPIFACTATAVNGGPDDTISETVISLYMNDPIIKIGSAKRENITFEINNYADKSYDEYKREKVDILAERIYKWTENKEKTIIYCPYSSIAHQMKNGEKNFSILECFKNDTCVYTGSGEDTYEKADAMEKFKNGEINVMYATKAFGMGIDIPDIKNVYHYAVTGGLNDYVQEIGRAARNQNIEGKAIVDYFNGDMKYMNSLFGMSQIKQYHIKKCLSIIYNAYKSKGEKRNFLINPKMFDGVFGNVSDDELANKLKIVLLMLEKDFDETYKTRVLISRPSALFTKAYLAIDKNNETYVLNKYGKYFRRVALGRNKEMDAKGVKVTDVGDVFEIDLKSIWEEKFGSEMSFPQFKFKFFNKKSDILGDCGQYVYERIKLKISTKVGKKLSDLQEMAKNEIDYLTDALGDFGKRFFTKEEFKEKIVSRYHNNSKAEIIANSYFDIVDSNSYCIKKREIDEIVKYQVSNGTLRELGKKVLTKSDLLKELNHIDSNSFEKFYSENPSDNNLLRLLSLLDLSSFEIEGGNNPEIFIRLNAPDKIKNIIEERVLYKNKYVELAKEKHYRSIKILDYFFRNLSSCSNEDKWNFIEQYFLGKNIEKIINQKNKEHKEKKENVSAYVDINDEKTYSLEDYNDWDSIINSLFDNDLGKKYIYYCKKLKNNNIKIPDYAFTDFKINNIEINTIFIYEKENLLIVDEQFGHQKKSKCIEKGWTVIKMDEIDDEIELIKGLTNG